ncbi:hypothetical protein [Massilia atriviolacea]|uniref:hypothetical protein n=1 Tax=Massilia atriviolacea TaxID=2495579 RepID=UPI0018E06D0A|nr:hypothetical protein [Massilia atriviolacea]
MSTWKTVASGTTTPVEDRTRIPAQFADSPCARAAIKIEAVAVLPSDRARTTVGVGESVKLSYSLGSAKWSNSGGTLDKNTAVSVFFTAPDRAASVTITATGAGCTCTVTFTVIEPDAVVMERASSTVWHIKDIPSIGIRLHVYLRPDTVSFKSIEVSEGDCTSLVTGYFVGTRFDGMKHGSRGGGEWAQVSDTVAGMGSQLVQKDHARSGACNLGTPYTDGSFDWPIPWLYRVGDGEPNVFATVHQQFTIDEAGCMTLSKGGASGAAALNDPSSDY